MTRKRAPDPRVGKSNLKALMKKALRQDGRGRPPSKYTYDPATVLGQRDVARARAAAELETCIVFFALVRDGEISATLEQIRAVENICDRGGMGRHSEVDIGAAQIPVKLFRLGGYRTKDGVQHELPADPAGDPGGAGARSPR